MLAWRTLRKSPGFTAIAIVSLALGIGANTTLFSALNTLLFRSLPYPDAGRLIDISEDNPKEVCAGCAVGTSHPSFVEWRGARSVAAMGAYLDAGFALAGEGPPERVGGAYLSAGAFEALGTAPLVGRGIGAADDQIGAPPVVVLGHGVWQRRFGSDRLIVGRMIRLNGVPHTVIGVMPPRFGFPELANLWVPLEPARPAQSRGDRSLGVIGRLKPGVAIEQARAEMASIGRTQETAHPEAKGWTVRVEPFRTAANDDAAAVGFALALAAAALVLLIACANLTNLMLARTAARVREVAVRVALGASRGGIIRQFLAESLLLSAVGGAAGLALALWGLQAIVAVVGAHTQVPPGLDWSLDWRVFLFTSLVIGLTGVGFGLLPALTAARTDIQSALKLGLPSATGSRADRRIQSGLVAAQVALALTLLIGSGLLVKSFFVANQTDNLGYEPRGVLSAEARLLETRYDRPDQIRAFGTQVLEQLGRIPGREHVALEHTEFLGTFVGQGSLMSLEGAREPVPNAIGPRFARAVTPEYFRLLGIPVVEGRPLVEQDGPAAPPVAVINRVAAARLWPGQTSLGRRFRIGPDSAARWYTVVGVAGDVVGSPLGRTPTPLVYLAFAQAPGRPISLLVKRGHDPEALAPLVKAAVTAIDPDQPVESIQTMEQALGDWLLPVRLMTTLIGGLGLLALALSVLGLYGLLAYLVARRRRELGIRLAVGASHQDLRHLVMTQGIRLAVIGIAIGLPVAAALSQLLRMLLFSVSSLDLVVYLTIPLVLLGVAALASYLPARRAALADPIEALRAE